MLQAQPATPSRPSASPLRPISDEQKGNKHQENTNAPGTASNTQQAYCFTPV
jgi:hypothetical protein